MGTSTLNLMRAASVTVPANFAGNHFGTAGVDATQGKTFVSHDKAGCQWNDIHTADGVFNWTALDAAVTAMASGDWIYTLWGTPSWLTTNAGDGRAGRASKPSDYTKLTAFIVALCTRYSGLTKLEIWNEPDVTAAPIWWSGTVAEFVTLAQTVYNAAKSVRAGIEVVGPGCTNYISSPNWLSAFFVAGGAAYLDAISMHCYQLQYGTPNKALLGICHGLSYHAKAMSDNGISKPIKYCTEFGQINPLPSAYSDAELVGMYKRAMVAAAAIGFQSASWYLYDGAQFGYSDRPAVVSAVAAFVTFLGGATITAAVINVPEFTVTATINGTSYTF